MLSKLGVLIVRITTLLTRFQSFPILLIRIAMGIGFAITGWGKLHKHDDIARFFTDLGIPFPGLNAWFVGAVEFIGGALLVAGLGTRVVAFMLSFTLLIATLTSTLPELAKKGEPYTDAFLTIEVTGMLTLLWLVFSGAGAISLDRLVAKKFAPQPPPKPGA